MLRLIVACVCGVLVFTMQWSGTASAAQSSDHAATFIKQLGGQVLATLEDRGLSQQARTKRFYDLFRDSFNEDRISSFALGKYRRTIAPERFEEYRELFGKYMTGLYAAKFANYSGETFAVTGARELSDGENEVAAEIRRRKGEPIRLAFRIDRDSDQMKIYDVVIEGVSLLFAKRHEVTSVIARDGMDKLIDRLREAVQLAELQ